MTHESRHEGEANRLLADLCNEAVARYGSDWMAIEKHVADRLKGMSDGERSHLMRNVQAILNFSSSQRSDLTH